MKKFLLVAALLILANCGGDYKSLDDAKTTDFGTSDEEKELFSKSEQMLSEMKSKGMIIESGPIYSYVNDLGRSLLPPQMAPFVNFRFFVVRDPRINAFSTANGYVFINLGLVARVENRLELAQVIAHETGHVIKRHVYATYEDNATTSRMAHFTDLALFGTHLAYIPYQASIMSHSRDKEQAADEYSAQVLSRLGYDMSEIGKLFAVLSEVKKGDQIDGSIWSDHPADAERAAYLQNYVKQQNLPLNKGGIVGDKKYAPIRKEAVIENVNLKLINKQYQLAIDSIAAEIKLDSINATLYSLLGDSYRKLAEDPEGAAEEKAYIDGQSFKPEMATAFVQRKTEFLNQALTAYNHAITLNPNFRDAWRGRGLASYLAGDKSKALADLNHYLNFSGEVADHRYIMHIIEGLKT